MDRMKTFFIYFLLFVGMFIVFNLLENGLTASMFGEVKGTATGNDKLAIEVSDAKASNVNGYMDIKVTNTSDEYVDKAYAQVDLIDEYGNVVSTEYITVEDLAPGESKSYKVKYDGNNIEGYKVAVVDEIPDKSNVIDIFGWEVEKNNVFGVDLTDLKIFGIDVGNKIIDALSGAKKYGRAGWSFFMSLVDFVPMWAYAIATLIVISYF